MNTRDYSGTAECYTTLSLAAVRKTVRKGKESLASFGHTVFTYLYRGVRRQRRRATLFRTTEMSVDVSSRVFRESARVKTFNK